MNRAPITTHVLDTAAGRPAAGIPVTLRRGDQVIGRGVTDDDGRVMTGLIQTDQYTSGAYQIEFQTADYLIRAGQAKPFYPVIVIVFEVDSNQPHYHIPILLSPFGYTTYRGS